MVDVDVGTDESVSKNEDYLVGWKLVDLIADVEVHVKEREETRRGIG